MKIQLSLIIILFTLNATGQTVNEKITLQLSQASVLRVNAGTDLNLNETGSAIIGESIGVNGGTPEFSYEWYDEFNNEFYEKTPEVNNSGKYWLTVTDHNNCSAVDSLVVWDYGTGLMPIFSKPEENVVLDGFNKILHIELPEVRGSVTLSILSIDGKMIYSLSRSGIMNHFSHQVDLSSAEKGIYLFCIQYNDRKSAQKLILK